MSFPSVLDLESSELSRGVGESLPHIRMLDMSERLPPEDFAGRILELALEEGSSLSSVAADLFSYYFAQNTAFHMYPDGTSNDIESLTLVHTLMERYRPGFSFHAKFCEMAPRLLREHGVGDEESTRSALGDGISIARAHFSSGGTDTQATASMIFRSPGIEYSCTNYDPDPENVTYQHFDTRFFIYDGGHVSLNIHSDLLSSFKNLTRITSDTRSTTCPALGVHSDTHRDKFQEYLEYYGAFQTSAAGNHARDARF
jgi:hypothetical protein